MMNRALILLAAVIGVFLLGVSVGHYWKSTVDARESAEKAVEAYGATLELSSKLYSTQLALDSKEDQLRLAREKKTDKAIVKYVKEIGNNKCLSSSGFVQFYNSTFQDTDASK